MLLMSFNVNGVRARYHQLEAVFESHQPDILGIQEVKVIDEDFPKDFFEERGYHITYFGQKSHYGVAVASKQKPLQTQRGWPGDAEDAQRRVIISRFQYTGDQELNVINGYFPQGESRQHPTKFPGKVKFYTDLQSYIETQHEPDDLLVVMGDLNVAPTDDDIGIGDTNAKRWLRTGKCSFLPEERAWIENLRSWGLQDSYRILHPEVSDRFSWFDYRSRGFEYEPKRGLRIDQIWMTQPLVQQLTGAGIDYDIRSMTKPSDHCPIWARLNAT